MTAPVTEERAGVHKISFAMPPKFTLETLQSRWTNESRLRSSRTAEQPQSDSKDACTKN